LDTASRGQVIDNVMQESDKEILVIGRGSPLLEGVSDLLQLAGYTILRSLTWAEAERQFRHQSPSLAIADLSSPESEAYLRADGVWERTELIDVPVLFVNLAQDNPQRAVRRDTRRRARFFSSSLLGMDGLLEEVRSCLA
jgi:hypothetical protein